MVTVTIEIHRSLRKPEDPREYVVEVNDNDRTLGQIIADALSSHPEIKNEVLDGTRSKPGILYIANKTELRSLGLIDTPFNPDEDLKLKIVPVLHGG